MLNFQINNYFKEVAEQVVIEQPWWVAPADEVEVAEIDQPLWGAPANPVLGPITTAEKRELDAAWLAVENKSENAKIDHYMVLLASRPLLETFGNGHWAATWKELREFIEKTKIFRFLVQHFNEQITKNK